MELNETTLRLLQGEGMKSIQLNWTKLWVKVVSPGPVA